MAERKLIGLIGRPVTQSAGQYVFNAIFREKSIDAFYVAMDVAAVNLASFLNHAGEFFSALNVTSPHKNTVIDFCDKLSPTAQKTQSVNLLIFNNGSMTGDNLDVHGFKNLISRNGVSLADKNVVVVGSGGAARSVIYAISESSSPAGIYVASRDPDLTERKLEAYDYDYPVIPYHEMFRLCDVVINCTPNSAERVLPKPPAWKEAGGVAIDLAYNPFRTVFLKIMEDAGWRILNGEDMFIGQGVATFHKLFGPGFGDVENAFRSEFLKFRESSP